PDGEWLATGGRDHVICLLRGSSLIENRAESVDVQPSALLQGHTGGLGSLKFSPDRQTPPSSRSDGTGRLWRIPQDPEATGQIEADDLLWISGEHKQLIAVKDGQLYQRSLGNHAGWTKLNVPAAAAPSKMAISADGKLLALANASDVELWN